MAFELIETLTKATGEIRTVCADDNYLYVGSHDGNVYVYNKSDFSLAITLSDSEYYIREVYVDSDYIYSGDSYNNIYIYNKSDFSIEITLTESTNTEIRSIYTDSNYIYVSRGNKYLYLYNKTDFSLETTLTDASSGTYELYADSDYIYIGAYSGNIYIYNKSDFSLEITLSDTTDAIQSICVDDNYIYAGSWNGSIYIYNKSDFSLEITLSDTTDAIQSICVDDNYIYAGSWNGSIYIYNKSDFSLNTTLNDATNYVCSVFADDYLYVGSDDNNVYIYQLPVSYQYAYGDILSASTESIIEASANFTASATMSIDAQRIKTASLGTMTGTATMTISAENVDSNTISIDFLGTATTNISPQVIANAGVNMTVEAKLSMRPYIIANASADLIGQAIMKTGALRLIIPEGIYEITADDYFTKNQPADSSSVANYIIVETQPLKPGEIEELFSTNEVRTIEAGETIVINAEYSSKPAMNCSASLKENTVNTSITNANYYACRAEIEITNSGTSQESLNLIIEGKPLEISGAEKVFAKDDRSITENGEITYELPENHLIQTKEMGQIIANKLKDSFADPKRDVSLDWRGNPALILADPASVPEFQKLGINKIGQFYITKQELEYNGGLRANLEGRKNE